MKKKWLYSISAKGIWTRKVVFINQLAFFMMLGILPLSAKVFSQNEVVSLQMKEVSLVEVLKEISRQTGYDFLYNHDLIGEKGPLSVGVVGVRLGDFLKELLEKYGLEYEVQDKLIGIRPLRTPSLPQLKQKVITGVVRDSEGHPLPGVTIYIKGTQLGTSSGTEGRFSLNASTIDRPTLVFSFVGMNTLEIKVTKEDPLSVVMEEKTAEMEEVVITGYFNKTRQSFTGSEVSVKGEELKKVGSLNIIQALSAFDPSLRLAENREYGSDPNVIPDITVRGENGFDLRSSANDAESNPNAPLYIVDGVEYSATRVYDLNMNRIDRMTILKDATATALYGSRGANGVILITLKRPVSGKIRIAVNANYNVSIPDLRDYNLMNAEEKLLFEKLAGKWTDKTGVAKEQMRLDMLYNEKLEDVRKGVNTYWLSKPLQRSLNQRYSIGFDGGDNHFRYGIDLRYDRDQGVMKGSGRSKYGIEVNFNYNIGQNFYIRNVVLGDVVKAEDSPYGSFSRYAQENPYDRIRDNEGEFIAKLSSGSYNPLINPTLPNFAWSETTNLQDNFSIDWRIIPSLRLQGMVSYTKELTRYENYKSPHSVEYVDETDKNKKGSYTVQNSRGYKVDGNFTLSYFRNIGKGVLSVGVGSNLKTGENQGDYYTGTGFISDNLDFIGSAAQFQEKTKPFGNYDKSRLVGFFGNANYGYDNRYFLDLSYRTDGSSKFGKNSRFAPFWSAGVAWNADKEHFWHSHPKNSLKVRFSVGKSGSVNFSSSQALTTYRYNFNNEYNGYYGVELDGYGNKNLKWQNTLAYNWGVDFTFLRGRVTFNGDAYIKITDNLLLPIDVAPSTGFLSYVENLGEMKNTGLEGRLRVVVLENRARDLHWNVTLSAFHNKNVIQKLSSQLDKINNEANLSQYNYGNVKPLRAYETGRSQSALMVVPSAGIDPITGDEVYIKLDGSRTFEYDYRDKIIAGDMYPDVEGNINTNFTWKGLNVYLLFKYKWGGKIYNTTLASKVEGADPRYNADRRALYDRWQKPGDEARFRRISSTIPPRQTTRLVFDDNLFSWQSLSVSYDLPLKYAGRIHAERLKVMLSMTDIFRLSTVEEERGTMYPFARTFTVGLNVEF